jgi:ribosome recycling factor
MNDTLDDFINSLKKISIDKIDLDIVKNTTIKYQNKVEKIKNLSTFNIKSPYIVHIFPIYNNIFKIIETSIMSKLSNINVRNDGKKIIVQVSLPNLDQRNLLVKKLKSLGEHQKVKPRNIRRDHNNKIKKYIKTNKKPIEYENKYTKITQKSIDDIIKNLNKVLLQKIGNIVKI